MVQMGRLLLKGFSYLSQQICTLCVYVAGNSRNQAFSEMCRQCPATYMYFRPQVIKPKRQSSNLILPFLTKFVIAFAADLIIRVKNWRITYFQLKPLWVYRQSHLLIFDFITQKAFTKTHSIHYA